MKEIKTKTCVLCKKPKTRHEYTLYYWYKDVLICLECDMIQKKLRKHDSLFNKGDQGEAKSCLRCEKDFISTGPHHRICRNCKRRVGVKE